MSKANDEVNVGHCPQCNQSNSYASLHCVTCSERLPWAAALTQARQEGREEQPELESLQHELNTVQRQLQIAQEQEARYRRVLELVQAALYRREINTNRLTMLGGSTEDMTGYAPAELTAEVWSQLVQHTDMRGPASGLSLEEALQLSRSGNLPHWSADYRIRTCTGEERWIADDSIIIRDATGRILESLGLLQDITDRKDVEASLQRSSQEILNIWESISDAFFALDQQWRFTYMNSQAEVLLQKSRAELLGQGIWEEFPEAVDSNFQQQYQRAIDTQTAVTFEEYYPPFQSWFEVRAFPSPVGLSVYFHDITQRKLFQAELDVFFSLSLDLLCVAGFDGYFKHLNPSWPKTLGYTSEELMSRPFLDFVHEDDQAATLAAAQQLNQGEEVVAFENRYRCRDGSYRWLLWMCAPFRQRNLIFAVAHDITERKEMEQSLRDQTRQLERSNRELQDFAYVASHDLQEPLRKIQAFADALQRRYTDQLDEKALDYIGRMQRAANRMSSLINDLLALSRVATHAHTFESVNLTTMLLEVLSDAEISIKESQAEIHRTPLPTIEADPSQMRQLLQNLIGNAIKFRHPGQAPRVNISADMMQDGKFCQIQVQDNGIGFDEKFLDRIFSPFQRLHGRAEYEGTGMGLAICRRIAERHGGSITAHSIPGAGTTFVVTLPFKQSKG